MILFWQLHLAEPDKHKKSCADYGTTSEGKIGMFLSLETFSNTIKIASYFEDSLRDCSKFGGSIVNLETGKIISAHSSYKLPEWVRDPLLRAMKVAQFKHQQRKPKGQKK